jgi:hypothetical protein
MVMPVRNLNRNAMVKLTVFSGIRIPYKKVREEIEDDRAKTKSLGVVRFSLRRCLAGGWRWLDRAEQSSDSSHVHVANGMSGISSCPA